MIHTKQIIIEEDRLSLYSIARELESVAGEHAALLGVGEKLLLSHGITWVLIRRELQIDSLPARGQKVMLETWPGKTRHGFYPRRFRFMDEEGNILISCSCTWALMDIESRTMVSPKEYELTGIKRENEQKPPVSKVDFPELTEGIKRTVREDETDTNGHLNNAHYLKWIDEIMPEGAEVKQLWIEYAKEILPGEEVDILFSQQESTVFIKGMTAGETAFRIKLKK